MLNLASHWARNNAPLFDLTRDRRSSVKRRPWSGSRQMRRSTSFQVSAHCVSPLRTGPDALWQKRTGKWDGGGSRTRTCEGLASGFTVRPLCRSGHSPTWVELPRRSGTTNQPAETGSGAFLRATRRRCQPKQQPGGFSRHGLLYAF